MAEFKFFCPQCGQQIQCDTGYAGTQINCPACNQTIVVPVPAPSAGAAKKTNMFPVIFAGAAVFFVAAAGLFLFWEFGHSSGLVGLWSGEGNGRNSAGENGKNAQLTNVTFAEGKVGQAFVFNGESSEIKIPGNREFRAGLTNGFTLEAWVKPLDVSRQNPIFEWNTGDGNTYWGVHFYIQPHNGDGALYANVMDRNGGWHQIWSPGGTVVRNEFRLVALTYDRQSGLATLYRNGEVVGEQDIGCFAPQTSYNLYIGRRPMTHGEAYDFEGLVDEPELYNRALSDREIKADYRRHQ